MSINLKYILTTHLVEKMPNDDISEIVISGKSNVGKSTLINKLGNNKNLAKISSKPGKTRAISLFQSNNDFRLVDIPGYGYAKVSKKQIKLFEKMISDYFAKRKNIKKVILLLDIRRGITEDDKTMINFVRYYKIPLIIIGTKLDKAKQSEIAKFKKSILLNYKDAKIIKYSAISNKGLKEIEDLFLV